MAPLIEGFHIGYERKGIYTVEFVLNHLGSYGVVFDGDKISVASSRLRLFARSRICVCCGIAGTYFAKERSAKTLRKRGPNGEVLFKPTAPSWHFNLYALTADGREILMTKDHIIPRSKGGTHDMENLQTMCSPCNCRKQDNYFFQPMLPFDSI